MGLLPKREIVLERGIGWIGTAKETTWLFLTQLYQSPSLKAMIKLLLQVEKFQGYEPPMGFHFPVC